MLKKCGFRQQGIADVISVSQSSVSRELARNKTSRGQIKNRVSIDDRPLSLDEKNEVGHWAIDTMISAAYSGALVTIVERAT